MVAFLEGQIEHLGKQVEAFPRGAAVGEMRESLDQAVSLALDFYERLRADVERALPPDNWNAAAARAFVPRYQKWYDMARKTLALIREAKAVGVSPTDVEPFMFAYLEAKAVAEDFDKNVEVHRLIGQRRAQRGGE